MCRPAGGPAGGPARPPRGSLREGAQEGARGRLRTSSKLKLHATHKLTQVNQHPDGKLLEGFKQKSTNRHYETCDKVKCRIVVCVLLDFSYYIRLIIAV